MACSLKKRFNSVKKAAGAANRANDVYYGGERKVRYYECPCCGKYHLTKQDFERRD